MTDFRSPIRWADFRYESPVKNNSLPDVGRIESVMSEREQIGFSEANDWDDVMTQ